MLSQGSTLIVDDKLEDGQPISDHLKELCIPHLFFHANEDHLIRLQKQTTKYVDNFRVVFQDIALTSGTTPTTKDYDYAATILEALLSDNNGPWLLVTWSTWNGEDESGYAKQLFEHLVRELGSKKAPYAFVVIDKSHFTSGKKHGTVKPFGTMSEDERQRLNALVTDAVKAKKSMNVLMAWEKSITRSISETLVDLYELSGSDELNDKKLGGILCELARAVAGKSLSKKNSWASLVGLLNNQLLDRISNQPFEGMDVLEYAEVKIENIDVWKKDVNRLLHFEVSGSSSGPGSIYSYNSFVDCYLSTLKEWAYDLYLDREKLDGAIPSLDFVKEIFISRVNSENKDNKFRDEGGKLVSEGEFVIIDVTPPCDYAQNKAELKKFCAGVIIDTPSASKKSIAAYKKTLLEPCFLWGSCDFSSTKGVGSKNLIMNSRLIFSLPCVDPVDSTLIHASISRMREEIFRDFTHWLWQQMSRPGYTYM